MMTEKCFDEGIIQAFLDGELASDFAEKVACHVAMCNDCAVTLALAEEENSFAFATLDTEFNALVPTERIRTRLFETIQSEKISFWQRIFGHGFRWTNPSVAAFASLILAVGLFGTLWIARENHSNTDANSIAVNNQQAPSPVAGEDSPGSRAIETFAVPKTPVAPRENPAPQMAVYRTRNENRNAARKVSSTPANEKIVRGGNKMVLEDTQPAYSETILGEESYIRTIATLKQTVDGRKDELLKPSTRVAFEKDMALVNDAIEKLRDEVRRNPRNQAAKEMLRVSYQNKIDLLNSVAEKSELIATLY